MAWFYDMMKMMRQNFMARRTLCDKIFCPPNIPATAIYGGNSFMWADLVMIIVLLHIPILSTHQPITRCSSDHTLLSHEFAERTCSRREFIYWDDHLHVSISAMDDILMWDFVMEKSSREETPCLYENPFAWCFLQWIVPSHYHLAQHKYRHTI